MIDLSRLGLACKWAGIALDHAWTDQAFIAFDVGTNAVVNWDGKSDDWEIARILVCGISRKVAGIKVERLDETVPFGTPRFTELLVREHGTDLLNAKVKNLTTTLAATALLEMHLAAEGKG